MASLGVQQLLIYKSPKFSKFFLSCLYKKTLSANFDSQEDFKKSSLTNGYKPLCGYNINIFTQLKEKKLWQYLKKEIEF